LRVKGDVVGAAGRCFLDPGIEHFADEHRVIAVLDVWVRPAFDVGGGALEQRRTGHPGMETLAIDGVAVTLGGLEESKGETRLPLPSTFKREMPGLLDDLAARRSRLSRPPPPAAA